MSCTTEALKSLQRSKQPERVKKTNDEKSSGFIIYTVYIYIYLVIFYYEV